MSRLARYQPPSIPPQVLIGLVLLFALLSFARGLDYVVGDDRHSQSLIVLDALGDLRAWGVGIMVAALLVVIAYGLQRHFLIWCSHVLLGGVYVCVSITVAQSVILVGDGWAVLVPPAGAVVWHALLAALTGPFPRRGAGHGT
jgi:hypothetical protein